MSDQDYPDGIAAVGIIEATGFVPVFDAVDAMTKAAEIVVCSVNKIGAHLVACIIEGELAAVRVALDVGEESARAVGATDVRTVVFASPSEPISVLAESAPELLGARWMAARAGAPRGSRSAIGMIETKGLVPLAVAIEAMVKTTDVTCVAIDRIGDGYLAAAIVGGVAPVRYAMEAGVDAARGYGEVSAAQVYPQPHEVSRGVVEGIASEMLGGSAVARLAAPKGS